MLTSKLPESPIIYFFSIPLGNALVSISTFSASQQAHTLNVLTTTSKPPALAFPAFSQTHTFGLSKSDEDPAGTVLLVRRTLQVERIYYDISRALKTSKHL